MTLHNLPGCYARIVLLRPAVYLLLALAVSSVACGQAPPITGDTISPSTSNLPRFEVGLQMTQIRTYCVGTTDETCEIPSFALGLNGTWNVKRFLAIDANYVVTPSAGTGSTTAYGGRISELMAGVRVEARAKRYGYYIEAQPGYLRWSNVITGVNGRNPDSVFFDSGSVTHFISDVGLGVEFSPSSRIHVRGELADLIYRYSSQSWVNDFQPSVSVNYGLGKSLSWASPQYDDRNPFFTTLNDALLAGSALAISADAITTQRFIASGYREGDPLARPLVKYGWSGQVAASALELGAETLAMYRLHRIRHHWIERILPVGVATTHAVLAYNNTKISDKSP
jgi:hypothetical protein